MLNDKAIEAQMQNNTELSEGQMVKLLLGDTETQGETPNGEGDQTPEVAAAQETVIEEQPAAEKSEVLAKDGKHTIPFEELERAREEAKHWQRIAEENSAIAESLKQAQEKDAVTGTTEAQADLIAELRESFPEIAEAVQKLVDSRIVDMEKRFTDVVAPLKETAALSAEDAHFRAIKDAHSDFETLRDSQAMREFLEAQPSFVRDRYQEVLEQGTATEVIELFDTMKKQMQQPPVETTTPTPSVDVTRKAAEVAAAVKPRVPVSLTDIPAGAKAHHDEAAAVLEMNGMSLLNKFEGKSPEQIEALVSRVI